MRFKMIVKEGVKPTYEIRVENTNKYVGCTSGAYGKMMAEYIIDCINLQDRLAKHGILEKAVAKLQQVEAAAELRNNAP